MRSILLATAAVLAFAPASAAQAQSASAMRPAVDVTARANPATERSIGFARQAQGSGILVLPVTSEADIGRIQALDGATRQAVTRALAAERFNYGSGSVTLRGLGTYDQIVVMGVPANAGPGQLEALGERIGRAMAGEMRPVSIVHALPAEAAVDVATGIGIGGYGFNRYRTMAASAAPAQPIVLVGADGSAEFARRGQARIAAMRLSRDLSNEPPNVLYPETFVSRVQEAFAGTPGVQIQVLDEAQMAQMGMGSILSVSQGSQRPARIMIVSYRGQGAPAQPVTLVGKGITFDTGGISLKPGAGMGAMKMDMSGAAAVMGTALALAQSRAPVNVVAIAALAENMPSGTASRPSDVVRAMNGKTIEIISTDAEGRMVLADALSWAEANLDSAAIVDIATLTGAIGTALGEDYAGLFTRHDGLSDQLLAAADSTNEGLWRMPLHPRYAQALRSQTADLQNTGGAGAAGAGTGAHFIGEFVEPGTPWAHLDIAGVDNMGGVSRGYGVRLLERFVLNFQPVARND